MATPVGSTDAVAAGDDVAGATISDPDHAAPSPAGLPESAAPAVGARGHGRSARSTASPAAASDTGSLHVETPGGWADVYLDGRRAGRTPLDVELPRGRVRLELRPFGLAPLGGDASMRRSVTIGERPARIVVPLSL